MPRSRPTSNPLSYHKYTGQYYITRAGKRIYLGADQEEALQKFHRMNLGLAEPEKPSGYVPLSAKQLANRFLASQQANWRNPDNTLRVYRDWLGRFLKDHPRLTANDFTVEMFAVWKMSLRKRQYSVESINHYLSAVRAMFAFAEETDLLEKSPRLKRVKNESPNRTENQDKPLYTPGQIASLLENADSQLKSMLLLGLNCGFGPKDMHDLTWKHITEDRITLPRSKTGVSQTFLLWPETLQALYVMRQERAARIKRLAKRGRERSDNGNIFVTRFWKPWKRDSVSEQFRRLCDKAGVPCYGIYRLRHCASTAMSLVAMPHVHRRFMRHAQLQQQVTYTHTPDGEVDEAVMKAKEKLLGRKYSTSDQERNPEPQVGV